MKSEVVAALQALEVEGTLATESVVAAAVSPTSPLHAYFTWDNSEAAHQHRLDQARKLIQSYKVRFIDSSEVERLVPGYVSIPTPEAGPTRRLYVRTELALSDEELKKETLNSLRREIRNLQAKYGHLKEYAEIVSESLSLV